MKKTIFKSIGAVLTGVVSVRGVPVGAVAVRGGSAGMVESREENVVGKVVSTACCCLSLSLPNKEIDLATARATLSGTARDFRSSLYSP